MIAHTIEREIAENILKQLGGHRFIIMTGSKNLIALESGLAMKIGKNSKKVTHVRIKLNSMDLYDVEYLRIWGTNISTISESNGIYNDMLIADFESNTGLYTSL